MRRDHRLTPGAEGSPAIAGAVGALIVGAIIGLATFAPTLTPQDPIRQELNYAHFSPSRHHPFGTDQLGRDVLARVAYGARISLGIAAIATMVSALLGAGLGLAAGSAGGWPDSLLMRLTGMMMGFPILALILVMTLLLRIDTVVGLALLFGVTTWMPLARLVRAETVAISLQPFAQAATSLGATGMQRTVRHLGPHLILMTLVGASLLPGEILLMEAGLSFLGLGVSPPTPTWGDMVRHGMQQLGGAWWVAAFPGIMLSVAVLGLNVAGNALNDAFGVSSRPGIKPGASV